MRYLNPNAASCAVFVHHPDGSEDAIDPRDYTNFDTIIEPRRQPLAESGAELAEWVERLATIEGVQPDGSVSLAVRGLEFARAARESLMFGLDRKHLATHSRIAKRRRWPRG